jgi:hypothetical protein
MTYNVYYLVNGDGIVAGPFPTVDAAVNEKWSKKFNAPFASLLTVVKSIIEAEPV